MEKFSRLASQALPTMDQRISDGIATWLLTSGIQIQVGPERGAVAGWLDAQGAPAFAYPEITGYYLTCMAFMHKIGRTEPAIASNAQRAVTWLHAKCRNGVPLTRYFAEANMHDWRNDAIFSFDLAMVLRGLQSVKGIVDEPIRKETLNAFHSEMRKLISPDGQLIPYRQRSNSTVKDRWSTRPGPFQIKAAAALLGSDSMLDSALRDAAFQAFQRWRSSSFSDAGELHPTMYAVEGLILFGLHGCADAWRAAADLYRQCMERIDCARSDVVAQALRAGCILFRRNVVPSSVRGLETLVEALVRFVGQDGAIVYTHTNALSSRHQNAWGAMFAYQALVFYEQLDQAEPEVSLLC
jgi:hypothetical protein